MIGHVLIFLHLLGVVALAGAVALELVTLLTARSARTVEAARTALVPARYISPLAPIAALVILASGLGLAGRIGLFGRAWVILSIIMWLGDAIMSESMTGRRMKHAGQLAATEQEMTPALRAALTDRGMTFSCLIAAGMLGTFLYLMSSRPGWIGSIIGLVVGVAAGLAAAALVLRSRSGQREPATD